MQQILIYFFIAIGLSMDAFSLALAYGTTKININKIILLSAIVGIFHFVMPLLGSIIGISILEKYITNSTKIVGIVFLILAIEMYTSKDEEKKGTITSIYSMIVFAITVSIDSLTVGIGLSITDKNMTSAYIIFAIISSIFTLSGLLLGKKISEKYGKKAVLLGIIILLSLSIKYLL